jgi:hypothetical protein
MLKKCLGIALTVILLSNGSVVAQTYAETALLFSRSSAAGSARIQALGGAQIALGGDYSSALSNPAGLGMYNRSEFTFSPALSFYNNKASYNTQSEGITNPSLEESSSKFNIPGLSYVMNFSKNNSEGYLGGSFGFSFSRTNDFNSEVRYRGENTKSSIVDFFLENANGIHYTDFENSQPGSPTDLAYWNYLISPTSFIDPDGADDEYFTDAPVHSIQEEFIKTSGSSNQWSFSYGGNYEDIFFFGGGIGLTSIRYTSEKSFSEIYQYDDGDDEPIDEMSMGESLDIRGSGINVTLGAIVRPVHYFQAGLSFTSPTFYQITENYEARMNTYWNNFDYEGDGEPPFLNDVMDATGPITSEYNLTTPLKLSLGVAFIAKFGLISFDVEKTNPAKAKYSSDIAGISYNDENQEINDLYKSTFNYRIGLEYRHKIFRVRGGYGLQTETFKNTDIDNRINTFSGGAGIRLKKFFIDLTVINRQADSYYSPYFLSDYSEPITHLKTSSLTTMLTAGFTF